MGVKVGVGGRGRRGVWGCGGVGCGWRWWVWAEVGVWDGCGVVGVWGGGVGWGWGGRLGGTRALSVRPDQDKCKSLAGETHSHQTEGPDKQALV